MTQSQFQMHMMYSGIFPYDIYHRDEIFRFTIEVVRSTKTTKTVIETIHPKYHVIKDSNSVENLSIIMEKYTIDKDSIFDYDDFSNFIKENFKYEATYFYNDPMTYRDSDYHTIALGNNKELLEQHCIEKGFKKSNELFDGGMKYMNLINSICAKDKENPIPPKMVVCPLCKKQIKDNEYICRKDILLNKKDGDTFILERPIFNYNFYHKECNTIYEKNRKLDQLKNALYIVFDRTTDIIDIVIIPSYVDYIPTQYHVSTLDYSFLITIFKGENESIRLDLTNFPKFSDTFDDMIKIKRNGKVNSVYVFTYAELISVLQRVIDSIIEK